MLNKHMDRRAASGTFILVVVLCICSVVLSAACDKTSSVRISNRSSEPISLLVAGGVPDEVTILPGHDTSIEQLPERDLDFTLKHEDGSVLFSGTMTWRELCDSDFRLVVTDRGLQKLRGPARTATE